VIDIPVMHSLIKEGMEAAAGLRCCAEAAARHRSKGNLLKEGRRWGVVAGGVPVKRWQSGNRNPVPVLLLVPVLEQ